MKEMIHAIVMAVSLFAVMACSGNPDESKKIDVTIRSGELLVDKKNELVLWEPDQGVRRSTYRTFVFPLKHFVEKLGDPKNLKGEHKLKIETKRVKRENYIPADPALPRPDGGFNLITFSATILEKHP